MMSARTDDHDPLARAGDPLQLMRRKIDEKGAHIRHLEAELEGARQKYRAAASDRERYRTALAAIKRTESYRIGLGLVLLVKHPLRTSGRLVQALWRFRFKRRPTGAPTAVAPEAAGPVPPVGPPGAVAASTLPPATGSSTAAVRLGEPASRIPAPAKAKPKRPIQAILSDRLPVYAYVVCGVDLDDLRAFARLVGQCATAGGNHVALIITDMPQFSLLRDTRLAIEYIPDRVTWSWHRPDVEWDDFQADRIGQLIRVHHASRVFFVNDPKSYTLRRLLALNVEAAL